MDGIHRLTSSRAFRRVFSEGHRAQTGAVVCFALATREQRPPRFGVTATRRIGGSVARNRAKRRLREAMRARACALYPGTDVVLIATPAVVDAPFEQLRDDVDGALKRAGVAAC